MSKSNFEQYYKDIILPNKHRMNYLCLSNAFTVDIIFSPPRLISKFLQLEALVLDNIDTRYLNNILHHLIILPQLHSLTNNLIDFIQNSTLFYLQLFRVPKLKYCKIQFESNDDQQLLPRCTDEFSSIEYLVIKNCFRFQSLNNFLSYLPRLEACRVHSTVMSNHQKKLEKLNRGPIGQNYEEMKLKLIHNISSYTLSKVEERLLCRGWDFCVENKITNFLDFETDLELNAMKLQPHCHESIFRSICRQIHNASQQLIRTSKHKKISNLSKEELAALKSLKSNNNIIICKADKGNSIVILDKETYMKKAEEILKGKQFEPLNNDKFHREQEEKLNKYIFSLFKQGVIDNKLRYQLQSTCSSLSVFYGLPKAHKTGYPIRPIISTIGSYQYELSKYLAKAIRNARPQAKSYIKDSFEF
ncbi:unnamed protein product [Rotaria sp. Silwood1]|nr:unnamed protein product [Rotaria sp. Silwood1]